MESKLFPLCDEVIPFYYSPSKTLSHLYFSEVQTCKRCDLCKIQINTMDGQGKMAGAGNLNANFLILGLAPSCYRKGEIKFGVPFNLFDEELYDLAIKNERKKLVGKTSKIKLLQLIKGVGLSKRECYITNLLKCSTENDDMASQNELLTCYTSFLIREIKTIKPILVIGLGAIVRNFFGGSRFNTIYKFKNISFFFTYHPAYYLHSGNLDALQESIKVLKAAVESLGKE